MRERRCADISKVNLAPVDGEPPSPRRSAVLAAFHLVQKVQTPEAEQARADIQTALREAESWGWSEVTTTLLYARAVDADANLPSEVHAVVNDLIQRAELESDSAMLAAGLGMRAELTARSGNLVSFGSDASQAMLLLDTEADPLALASAMICVALAYEGLNMWELGDELYTRAEALLPLCDDPILTPVIRINRAQTRFWWTAALIEVGRTGEAAQIAGDDARTSDVMTSEIMTSENLPESWAQELRVNWLSQQVIAGPVRAEDLTDLARLAETLAPSSWLARTQIHLALAHDNLRGGRNGAARIEATRALLLVSSYGTTYQRSFALWTMQLVEQSEQPEFGTAARTYADTLARQRWDERLGRLATFRELVNAARLRGEHAHLLRRTLEDPLTGLGNRRALDERLDYLRATLGDGEPVSMLVVDIDDFKRVNDIYGHEVGDRVLRRVGQSICAVLRPEDLAFRFGGDEFGAIMAGAPAEVVQSRADQICQLVCVDDWSEVGNDLLVTVSVGAASTVGIADIDALYARADSALYAAKSDGFGLLRIAT
jgi:diguanylate cyclase (GGDEF)-like protein